MFKLVVLSFLAVVAAEPGALIVGPTAYSTVIAPGTTTITKQASSVVHPSPPLVYSSPLTFTHFIKKRSVAALPYAATYYDNTPLISAPLTTYSAPLIHTTPIVHSAPLLSAPLPYAAAHFIKKRSVSFLPTTYHTPTTYAAAAPILTSTYAATPLISSTPLISHPITYSSHPITYSPHFIKKRSTALLTPYTTLPSSYSHQSRIDYTHSAPYVTTYSSPIAYSSNLGYSHIF